MELLISFKNFKFEMSGVCCELTYKDSVIFERVGNYFQLFKMF